MNSSKAIPGVSENRS